MSDQEPEQLLHGPEASPLPFRLPTPPRWARFVAAVVALLLAGGVLLQQRHKQGPVAHPRPSVTESPSTVPLLTYFNVTSVCQAVVDGTRAFTVSFTLTNITSTRVTVRQIVPSLPLGGLRSSTIDVRGGLCDHPGQAPAGLDIDSGASLLVAFRFLLPAECPAPYPVAARIVLRDLSGAQRTDVVPVYPDLGGIDFPNCP